MLSVFAQAKDARGDIIEFTQLQNVSRERVYDIVCAMEGGEANIRREKACGRLETV